MLKKLISYLIIFSIFYSDAAWCGRYRSKSICNPEEARRTPSLKKNTTRVRSQSHSDFKRSNAALISPLKIKKTIPLGRGIVLSDDLSPSDTSMDISENHSQNSMSMGTISSSNSSPREDDKSDSPKSSPNPSPTKSLESSIETDSLEESNSPSFEMGLPEEKGPNVKPPLVHLLLDNKIQKEELKQGSGNENTLSLPLEPTVIFPMDPLKKFEEKVGLPLPSTQGEEQQIENKIVVDLIQETVPSEKPHITISKPQSNSSELPLNPLLPIPSLIVDSFSQESEQGSSSRKNSSDSLSDGEESTCNLSCLLTTVILPSPNQQESKQNVDSFSSSQTKSLKELENTQPILLETLSEKLPNNEVDKRESASADPIIVQPIETTVPLPLNPAQGKESEKEGTGAFSKKIPIKENLFEKIKRLNQENSGTEEKIEEKKESPLPNIHAKDLDVENGTILDDKKKGVLVSASHTIPKPGQTNNSREADAELRKSSNVKKDKGVEETDVPNEKTRLVPKNKQPLNLSQQKSELKKDGLEDEWVDVGSTGNSVKVYELHSFHGDRGGKEPNPFSINGEDDERILLEDEKEEKKSKPLPKFVPDYFKEKIDVPVEKKDPSPNLIVSLEKSASEEDGALTVIPVPQSRFAQFLKGLPQEDRANLRYVKKQVLDEEYTCAQKSAIALAIVIALLTTVGMNPIYSEGVSYIQETYKWKWIIDLEAGNGNYILFFLGILPTMLPDTLARNLSLLKKVATTIAEEGIKMGRTIRTALASLVPAMIPPFYLIKLERHNMEVTNTHGLNNQFAIAAIVLGIGLFADAGIATFDMIWEMEDEFKEDLKEWAKASTSLLAWYISTHALHSPMPSDEERIRQKFSKSFDFLKVMVPKMTEQKRDEIYDKLLNAKDYIKKDFSELGEELEEDNLDIAELFFVSRLLLACSDEGEEIKKLASSWARNAFIFGTVASASFMGTLNLQLMGDDLLQIVASRQTSEIGGWVFAAFGLYPLLSFYAMGMKNFFKKFLPHDSLKDKVLSAVAGTAFTVLPFVLSLQACDKWWENDAWMITAIPLLLAHWMTLTTFFCDSYSKAGTPVMKFHNKVTRKKLGYDVTSNYKTNFIIERIEGIQSKLKYFNDSILHWLQKGLEKEAYPENL